MVTLTPEQVTLAKAKFRTGLYGLNDLAVEFRVPSDTIAIVVGLKKPENVLNPLEQSIEYLGLKGRARNALLNANIRSIRQLLRYTPEQVRKLGGVGEGAVKQIIEALAPHGLKLKEGIEE